MKKLFFFIAVIAVFIPVLRAHSASSTITEGAGYACMGDDKSRKQTEQQALAEAKRNAVEKAATYLKSETKIKDIAVEKDIIEAYGRATVRILQEIEKKWYRDPALGECYSMRIQAEVIPDEKQMKSAAQAQFMDDPAAPLAVRLWSDKTSYSGGEKMKLYVKGNKPFYGRVVYRDAAGNLIQLLPNPYRQDSYFNGGVVYEIPGGSDRFSLEVQPPFGSEEVMLFASTGELGDISLKKDGGVYAVGGDPAALPVKNRGIKLSGAAGGQPKEFSEEKISLTTAPR